MARDVTRGRQRSRKVSRNAVGEARQGLNLHVVLYSGRGDGLLISAAALVAGVDALVRKTATQRVLLEAMRTAAESRPALSLTPSGLRQAATRLDVHDHAILALRAARTSWGRSPAPSGWGTGP